MAINYFYIKFLVFIQFVGFYFVKISLLLSFDAYKIMRIIEEKAWNILKFITNCDGYKSISLLHDLWFLSKFLYNIQEIDISDYINFLYRVYIMNTYVMNIFKGA